jgi:hypothetical protein
MRISRVREKKRKEKEKEKKRKKRKEKKKMFLIIRACMSLFFVFLFPHFLVQWKLSAYFLFHLSYDVFLVVTKVASRCLAVVHEPAGPASPQGVHDLRVARGTEPRAVGFLAFAVLLPLFKGMRCVVAEAARVVRALLELGKVPAGEAVVSVDVHRGAGRVLAARTVTVGAAAGVLLIPVVLRAVAAIVAIVGTVVAVVGTIVVGAAIVRAVVTAAVARTAGEEVPSTVPLLEITPPCATREALAGVAAAAVVITTEVTTEVTAEITAEVTAEVTTAAAMVLTEAIITITSTPVLGKRLFIFFVFCFFVFLDVREVGK